MSAGFDRLREIVARLRAPDGCPWDREQTHASLRDGLLEECHEVLDAIRRGDDPNLREELGDLLLQAVMHARIAEEEGRFDIDAVLGEVSDKLVRRHPHVFGDSSAADSAEVLRQWEEIKRAEKGASPDASRLDGVPVSLPALMRASKIQKKASRAGFDWDTAEAVLPKLREELDELEAELAAGDAARIEEELGDLLFAVVNLARKRKLDAEVLLHAATDKFQRRFHAMERELAAEGITPEAAGMDRLEAAWQRAKRPAEGHPS
jgi:MazG family protein